MGEGPGPGGFALPAVQPAWVRVCPLQIEWFGVRSRVPLLPMQRGCRGGGVGCWFNPESQERILRNHSVGKFYLRVSISASKPII